MGDIIFVIILVAIVWAISYNMKNNNGDDTTSSIDIDKENTDVTMKMSGIYFIKDQIPFELDQVLEKEAILLVEFLKIKGKRTIDLSSSIDAYKRIMIKVIKRYNYECTEEQLELAKTIFITCTLVANGDVANFIKAEFEFLGA